MNYTSLIIDSADYWEDKEPKTWNIFITKIYLGGMNQSKRVVKHKLIYLTLCTRTSSSSLTHDVCALTLILSLFRQLNHSQTARKPFIFMCISKSRFGFLSCFILFFVFYGRNWKASYSPISILKGKDGENVKYFILTQYEVVSF